MTFQQKAAQRNEWQWSSRLEQTGNADLGQRLEDAMLRMLKWCETNEVAVMAHTNISNGVTDDFEELARSKYWGAALDAVPNSRFERNAPRGIGHAKPNP